MASALSTLPQAPPEPRSPDAPPMDAAAPAPSAALAHPRPRWGPWATAGWLLAAFVALLFRGFLYRGLTLSRLGTTGAVVVTAALFALVHLQFIGNPDWYLAMLRLFLVGVCLGWLRARTGSLLPGIGVHALHDGVEAPLINHLVILL
jgi:membrane protease YdiL (CAAX protease family)